MWRFEFEFKVDMRSLKEYVTARILSSRLLAFLPTESSHNMAVSVRVPDPMALETRAEESAMRSVAVEDAVCGQSTREFGSVLADSNQFSLGSFYEDPLHNCNNFVISGFLFNNQGPIREFISGG